VSYNSCMDLPFKTISTRKPDDVMQRSGCDPACVCVCFLDGENGLPKHLLGARRWKTCNNSVNADFQPDFMLNYGELLPPMLADGVRVLIYIGLEVRSLSQTGYPADGCNRSAPVRVFRRTRGLCVAHGPANCMSLLSGRA